MSKIIFKNSSFKEGIFFTVEPLKRSEKKALAKLEKKYTRAVKSGEKYLEESKTRIGVMPLPWEIEGEKMLLRV